MCMTEYALVLTQGIMASLEGTGRRVSPATTHPMPDEQDAYKAAAASCASEEE